MDSSKIIPVVIEFLALATALESYGTVSFFWKLFAVAVGAILLLYFTTMRLATWVKPTPPKGVEKPIRRSAWRRFVAPGLILAGVCTVFLGIGLFVVSFYTINLKAVGSTKDQCEFQISAAYPLADSVSIPLPPRVKARCEPFDLSPSGAQLADVLMVDWDSLNPQLQLSNFSSPQRIGLRCTPCIDIESIKIRIEPPTMKWLSPGSRCNHILGIFVIGGALWLAAFIFFCVRSR